MSKIVIRAQFLMQPGKFEQGKAAVLALRERVLRNDPGVLLYEFFSDEQKKGMAMTEAYADEPSLLNHIAANDFSGLFDSIDVSSANLQVHGDVSKETQEKLVTIIGPFEHFLPL